MQLMCLKMCATYEFSVHAKQMEPKIHKQKNYMSQNKNIKAPSLDSKRHKAQICDYFILF